MKAFKLAIWAAFTFFLLVVFVSLIGQNTEPTTVTMFHYTTNEYPKWAVLIACLLIGAFLSATFFIVELIVLETNNIRLRRHNRKLERALAQQAGTTPASPGLPTSNGSGPAVTPPLSRVTVSPLEEDV